MKKTLFVLRPALLLIILLILYLPTFSSQSFHGRVSSIIDGDTLEIVHKDSLMLIRLNGIDSPEICQEFGERAKSFVHALSYSEEVEVISHGKDKYGRILGDIILPDGRNLNAELVKNGFAWWYKKYSSDKHLQSLEDKARNNRLGLWGHENQIPPWTYRHSGLHRYPTDLKATGDPLIKVSQTNNDTIIYITKTGSKYHRSSCIHLRRSKISISLEKAKKSYKPCSDCNPPN